MENRPRGVIYTVAYGRARRNRLIDLLSEKGWVPRKLQHNRSSLNYLSILSEHLKTEFLARLFRMRASAV